MSSASDRLRSVAILSAWPLISVIGLSYRALLTVWLFSEPVGLFRRLSCPVLSAMSTAWLVVEMSAASETCAIFCIITGSANRFEFVFLGVDEDLRAGDHRSDCEDKGRVEGGRWTNENEDI